MSMSLRLASQRAQRDRRNLVLETIRDQDGVSLAELTDIIQRDQKKIEHDVKELKKRGQIYGPDSEFRIS